MARQSTIGRLTMLSMIFKSPSYIAIAIASVVINYLIFISLVKYSNRGILLVTAPLPLIYLIIATGAILFSIAIYSIRYNAANKYEETSVGILGFAIPSIGSMIASCSCAYPIFATALIAAGTNIFAVSNLVSWVSMYQSYILLAILCTNLALAYLYLGVVARGCSIKRRK
ncbi:MAG: hypothetical protein KGH72_01120 [Candidatus Micrarchaeota archaeon]|nr:hypothetical protein [Candidatus Micrarchaeota archaeon]